MGRIYLFECGKCGFRARVAGGRSEGNDLKIRTMVCRECRSIYDCVIALRVGKTSRLRSHFGKLPEEVAPSLQAALARLPLSPLTDRQWREFDLVCPVDTTHRMDPWTAPGRCPRCKAYLERGALPFRVWD